VNNTEVFAAADVRAGRAGDVERRRLECDDLAFAAGSLDPVDMVFGGQAKELLQTRAVGIQTAALLQQFVAGRGLRRSDPPVFRLP